MIWLGSARQCFTPKISALFFLQFLLPQPQAICLPLPACQIQTVGTINKR